MAMTIQEAYIFGSTASGPISVAVNGTEAAVATNGQGTVVGPFADYGDTIFYRITNGATAPGVPLTVVFYAQNAAGRTTEIDRVTGTVNSSTTEASAGILPPTGSILVPPGAAKITGRAFGNTTAAVGVEAWVGRQVP